MAWRMAYGAWPMAHGPRNGEDSQLLPNAQCPMPNAQCPCPNLSAYCYIWVFPAEDGSDGRNSTAV
jgi:hypothetical protein